MAGCHILLNDSILKLQLSYNVITYIPIKTPNNSGVFLFNPLNPHHLTLHYLCPAFILNLFYSNLDPVMFRSREIHQSGNILVAESFGSKEIWRVEYLLRRLNCHVEMFLTPKIFSCIFITSTVPNFDLLSILAALLLIGKLYSDHIISGIIFCN